MPGELSQKIILVGDPDRVPKVSQHFDSVEIRKRKREFVTHTGMLNGIRLSVVSTGIGTDNIDIVINECDALHNVDFKKQATKDKITRLSFLRLGTCGAVSKEIEADKLVWSNFAIGIDGLMSFYRYHYSNREAQLLSDIQQHFKKFSSFNNAYVAEANDTFFQPFEDFCYSGITLTCPGFYGPQYRTLRAPLIAENILARASHFKSKLGFIANVEMETAGIYALSKLLGHHAQSISVVLDNGITRTISQNMQKAVEDMIVRVLNIFVL